MRGEEKRLTAGLADPDERDAGAINAIEFLQVIDGLIQILNCFVVTYFHSHFAPLQRLSVPREAREQIRRQADEARLSQFHRKIFSVLIDAVSFMQQNDRRTLAFSFWKSARRAHAFVDCNHGKRGARGFFPCHRSLRVIIAGKP